MFEVWIVFVTMVVVVLSLMLLVVLWFALLTFYFESISGMVFQC